VLLSPLRGALPSGSPLPGAAGGGAEEEEEEEVVGMMAEEEVLGNGDAQIRDKGPWAVERAPLSSRASRLS
jgi:hypothetical protein